MQTKREIRKPDLLASMVLLTGSMLLTSTAAGAEEGYFTNVNLFKNVYVDNLLEGHVQVAGNQHTGVHLSTKSQTQSARYVGQHEGKSGSNSGVHLSWQLSW